MKIADFDFDDVPAAGSAPAAPAPGRATVTERFAGVMAWASGRVAVADEEGSLTYAELDRLSDRIACFVHSLDLGPEAVVGVMFGRRRDFAAAALGVIKAGAVYAPIEPELPLASRRRLLDLCGARLLISTADLAGDLHRLQWFCPGLAHVLALDAEEIDALVENPGALMNLELWEHLAGEGADDILAGGWKSAFSGQPLPAEAMTNFGRNARRKVAALIRPGARALEIGCASGFTMRQVAPLCGSYLATDIARRNLDRIEAYALAHGLGQVTTRQLAARDVDVYPPGSFDLVILNSVVESFPGFAYLRDVLDKVLTLLAPGGAVFLGSIWDLDRKDALAADLAAYARDHAGQGLPARRDMADDLYVSADFFRDFAAERGGLALDFSAVDAPLFDPAPYQFDLVLRPDPAQPASRPARQRHDTRALAAQPGGPPAMAISPEQAAYVIFTSGTTGQPKAVVNEHRSLVNLAQAIDQIVFAQMQPEAGLNISCNASFAFDASVHQIFIGLLNGHAVHISGAEARREPARLHAFAEAHRLDLLELTPSFMALMVDYWREQGLATNARTCILGGEALSAELVRAFFALPGHADVRLINAYGPTECCVAVSHYDLTARNWQELLPPPIGRVIPGVRVEVRDQAGRALPEGVPGQIVIGGEGVGRGYLGDAELTARRFVADAQGGRWYQSGDLGRWLPGGLLQFMGREDRQVKIRGNRIELAEVEAAINAHPLVKRVAVVAIDPHGDGNRLLAAYVVPRPGFDPAALKAELDASQPSYLVPSWLVAVDEIPLNANGKVDEARLPRPAQAAARPPARPLAGETEERLADIWSAVLQVKVDDADADFFSLGGHSVLAVRLLAEVERAFGLRLPLAELFTCPSVAKLAQRIEAGQREGAWSPLVPVNAAGTRPPMLCFHPVGGNVICYQDLAQRLGPDQPVYMVQALGLEEGHALLPSVEDMAAAYLRAIRSGLPEGPLVFAGWSFGGVLAWEAARQWRKTGGRVQAVLILDAVAVPDSVRELLRKDEADYLATLFHELGLVDADELRRLGPDARLDYLLQAGRTGNLLPEGMDREGMRRLLGVFQNNALAAVRYKAQPQAGRALLVRPKVATRATPGLAGDDTNGWGALAEGGLELCWMEGNHNQMLQSPNINELVEHVRRHLDALA